MSDDKPHLALVPAPSDIEPHDAEPEHVMPLGGLVPTSRHPGYKQRNPRNKVNTVGPLVLDLLQQGYSREGAAAVCGVAYRTVNQWVQLGTETDTKEADPDYVEFANGVHAIEAVKEHAHVSNIEAIARGAPGNWRASAWWLASKFPSKYGEQAVVGDQATPSRVVVIEAKIIDEPKLGRTSYDDETE